MSTIRNTARVVRRLPGVRRAIEASDPTRRAARLADSGLIDDQLYAAQLGIESISIDEAAKHYVEYGHHAGLTLNALLDPAVIGRRIGFTGRPPLYDYVNSRSWQTEVSSVWSATSYLSIHPEAATHPAGPAGHLWDRVNVNPDTLVPLRSGGERELPWSQVGPVLAAATAEWAEQLEDERARHSRRQLRHPRFLPGSGLPASGPTVSVIMPVWNRGAGLRRAVESVLAQEWPWWELLIIDDGSWDDSPVIGELLASRDSRIRFLRREHEGVCATRNAGIGAATGEYIAFLDSDNTWDTRFLRDVLISMQDKEAETAYATVELIQHSNAEDGQDTGETVITRYRTGAPRLSSLLRGNSIDLNVLVSRTEAVRAVGGFDPTLRRAVDYDLILKLAERGDILHVPTVGAHYDNLDTSEDRISTTEPVGWNTVVRLRHLGEAARVRRSGVAVICIIQANDAHLPEKLIELSALADGGSSVIIAAVGVEADEWRAIRSAGLMRIMMSATLHHESEPFAYVVNATAAEVDREHFMVIDPRSRFRVSDIEALQQSITSTSRSAIMPLTAAPDGGVEAAGSLFVTPRRIPGRLFEGHPVEDPRKLGAEYEVPALSGRTFAIDTASFREAGGLDPLLYNMFEAEGLSLRLAQLTTPARLTVRTDIMLTQAASTRAFQRADLRSNLGVVRGLTAQIDASEESKFYGPLDQHVAGWSLQRSTRLLPVVTRRRRDVTLADGRVVPRLRWAIRTAAPAGPTGERWGDTHFARSLASALEGIGQEAVVLSREVDSRPARNLDDVEIVLRGMDRVAPDPGVLSMLWIISHPDLVTRAEVAEFDAAFAASLSWSRTMTDRWGLNIDPLLQCTDPDRFHPKGSTRNDEVLFVGNSRGIPRPTVMESVRAGVNLSLYGAEWERFVPPGAVIAERVENVSLGKMYEQASIVLNDHWADMKRDGFIANRLFDVVAAGGRALSDDVDGIEDIFSGAVRTYGKVSEIVPLLNADHDSLFPEDAELKAISARIRAEHSFARRAEQLLERALVHFGR